MHKCAFVAGVLSACCVPSHDGPPTDVHAPVYVDTHRIDTIANRVSRRHNIPIARAKRIVTIATTYEHATFPRAEDILAIVGIESSFKPKAQSNLKYDPAVGLMQVRLGVWRNIVYNRDMSSEEEQIAVGVHILRDYYKRTGHVHAAVVAYNVGVTNYKKGRYTLSYLRKYQRERTQVTTI